ncbi:hypothetical protein BC829DRAFT_383801 [Chytridium lagenaria]|nr:hypothetical protein BC829DRAFT_383801 [Chytridium lagenaria]
MPVPTTTTTTTTTSTTTTTTGVSTPPLPLHPQPHPTNPSPLTLPSRIPHHHQTVDIAIRILFAILAPTTTSNTTTPATQPPTRLDIISTTTLAHAAVLNLPFCTSTSGPSHPLLHALLLIHRITRNPLPASLQSPTHLLLAALILSEAQLSDRQTSTVVWSRLLEMAFSTGVSVPEYSAWLASLKLFLHQSFGVGGNNGQWKA